MSSKPMINWRPETVIQHLPWKLDSKTALGFLLILAVFSLVGWLYLTQASAVTTTSYRIDELRLELDRIKNQNASLSLEIAELQALSYIEIRARQLGLGPTTNVRYLTVENYPAEPDREHSVFGPTRVGYQEHNRTSIGRELASRWTIMMDTVTAWLVGEQ